MSETPLDTYKAVVKVVDGLKVEAQSRGFKVIMDEPEDEGGTNEGMNPMELILCGLGGCQTIVAKAFAEMQGIEIEDFWTEIEGDSDPRAFEGVEGVQAGYLEIRFKMHFKSNESRETLEEFADLIEEVCPVGQTLGNAIKMTRTGIVIEN